MHVGQIVRQCCLLLISCLFLGTSQLLAQNTLDISGKVVDALNQQPIVGASIRVIGTTNGALAADDGSFRILGVNPDDSLEVKYYGFESQIVQINGNSELAILMIEEVMGMDEVVVVAYGTAKKSDLTGSVSSVKMDDIEELPVSSLGQALQGRVAGVTVTQSSGSPGAGLDITIRGAGTINNSEPLYVVDGIVVNDINYLSVADIASTEVLKDAAAAAVYGARAANGVIVITTKRGTAGKTTVNVSSQISQSDYWKTIEVMPTSEYFLLENLAVYNPQNALVQLKRYETGISESADNDWLDIISRKGVIQNHSFSIAGGGNAAQYRLSGSLFDNLGVIEGTDYNRQTILADISTQPVDKIRFRANVSYTHDTRNRLNEGDNSILLRALRDEPTQNIFNEEGNLNGTVFREATAGTNVTIQDQYQVKGFLDVLISDDLTFTSQGSIDRRFAEQEVYNASSSSDPTRYNFDSPSRYSGGLSTIKKVNSERFKWAWQNRFNYKRQWGSHRFDGVAVFELEHQTFEEAVAQGQSALGNQDPRQDINAISTSFYTSGYFTEWANVGALLRGNYNFNGKYLLQANFRTDGSSRFVGEKWGFFPSFSGGWVLTQEKFLNRNPVITFLKLRSSWGQSGNNRVDNYAFSTRVNNGYRVVFGEDDVVDGATPTTVANSLISWEKTTSTNVGLDMILFNRVELNVDVFEKYTSDMLIRVPLVPSAGLSSAPLRNAGDVRNRGLEMSLNYRVRKQLAGKPFKVDVGGNLTYIQNEVVQLGARNEPVFGDMVRRRTGFNAADFGIVTRAEVGKPIGSFYGWVTDGIFQDEEEIAASAQAAIALPGDFRFKDLNGDGVLDEADRTYLGSPMPDLVYGLIGNFSWGNIDLSMAWQGVWGQQVFNMSKFYLNGFNGSNALAGSLGDYWHTGYFEGTEPITIGELDITESDIAQYQTLYPANTDASLPRLTTFENDLNQNYRPSDFFIEDASYLRLKNLQLSYNFRGGWLEQVGIANFKVYAMAQNLLTITQYSGLDPEIGKRTDSSADTNLNFGLDVANYPQTRSLTFGINLNI
ncbi:TonB-dependent receptor [Pontibacter sp. G13]|uniref:SusC/RagA family TonB-linked outer membrane protein n=1 Tax=Pontibacter sp. G13 TaxID=3074898 RepID=UPI00288A9B2D|nr:TonB-dependent receptor [Pontibacter sp. G13]WNJ20590.1 TonB-dependent receptor [Pontibacter sp. G13]